MTGEHAGGPPAPPGSRAVPSEDALFARPAGLAGAFAPHEDQRPYAPPPATVSPEQRATFGRPAGAAQFAPLPGERLAPAPAPIVAPDPVLAARYGAPAAAVDGFAPAPGTRLPPAHPLPESPWWKADARDDPWRDPSSRFWLGGAAIFRGGRPAQLDPERDSEDGGELLDDRGGPAADAVATVTPHRLRFGLSAAALTLVVGLVAGLLGGGAGYWLANRANHLLHRAVSLGTLDRPANRPPGSVAGIAQRVGPAVVSIEVSTPSSFAVGSGVVIDANGYVLTNNHVIVDAANGAGSIVVDFADEAKARAQIVGRDPISDLAVLKVPAQNLTVATLGNSDALAVGDPVIAIGSPLGLQGTVTSGIVSALGRAVHVFAANGSSDAYLNAIQTDAPINPGNSGGALVDAAGAVVGLNSAAAVGAALPGQQAQTASGIGYAIPINYARTIAEELIKSGKAVHGALGAQGRTATTSDSSEQGAYLEHVVPSGPADKAGLRDGDVVVAAGGKPVSSYDELVVIVQEHSPGTALSVTYFAGATKQTATVTLGSA